MPGRSARSPMALSPSAVTGPLGGWGAFRSTPLLPVDLLLVTLDARPRLDGTPKGLVVAAAGGGNTPLAYLELARPLIESGVPVVLTTRCPSGRPLAGYGFPGGSSTWWEAGAIFSGTLDALKARVLLALGIGAGATAEELAALCATFGGGRRPS